MGVVFFNRDRPAAIPVQVRHMADTSNFDDFEELEHEKKRKILVSLYVCPLTIPTHIYRI